MSGSFVQDIQQRLAQVGAVPTINGIFDEVTELAVELFQARSTDEAGEPLEIDGVVGPLTWGALFGPDSIGEPIRPPPPGTSRNMFLDTVLEIASSQVGVMENPPGSNRGAEVEAFLRQSGLGIDGLRAVRAVELTAPIFASAADQRQFFGITDGITWCTVTW